MIIATDTWGEGPANTNPNVTLFHVISNKAKKGDVASQVCLGEMYSAGIGTPIDYANALSWYKEAAKTGSLKAEMSIGEAYLYGEGAPYDQKKALAILQALIDKGYLAAAYPIGRMYYYGDNVPRDYSVAASWLEKASKGGSAKAETLLARMYKNGLGVSVDASKAEAMLEKVAHEKIECLPDFYNISSGIIFANQVLPKPNQIIGKPSGKALLIRTKIINGVADDPVVIQSIGIPAIDAAVVQAFKKSKFPRWPSMVPESDRSFALYLARNPLDSDIPLDSGFTEKMIAAIKRAVIIPNQAIGAKTTGNGTVTISFEFEDGKPRDVTVKNSSGDKSQDLALLQAVRTAKYPPIPSIYAGKLMHLSITLNFDDYAPVPSSVTTHPLIAGDKVDPSFALPLRDAIFAAVIMPKEVFINGSTGTGLAVVSFDYLDSKVTDAKIQTSSNDPYEDAEAIRAVEQASYPVTPPAYVHKTLHLSIGIRFESITPTAVSSGAPALTTKPH